MREERAGEGGQALGAGGGTLLRHGETFRALLCTSGGLRLCESGADDLVGHPVAAEALHEPVEAGVLFEALQVLSKPLSDIGADQGLIARKSQQGRNELELFHNIFWDTEADGGHRTIAAEAFAEVIHLHKLSSPDWLQAVPR